MYGSLNQAATLWDCHLSCTNDHKCSAFNWLPSMHVCYEISVSLALPVNLVKAPGAEVYFKNASCASNGKCHELIVQGDMNEWRGGFLNPIF